MPRPDALILCGGDGARLGGIDKPLRRLAGRPLIEHVLAGIAAQAGTISISANRNIETYSRYGSVINDGRHAGRGPLAGIVAGLATADTTLLCVPGDAALLPEDLVSGLEAARQAAGSTIAYADDGHGPQPLCCLIAAGLHDDLIAYLDTGGRTPRQWFARHRAARADFSHVPSWAWSLNTESEWQAAEAALAALKLCR